MKVEATLKKVLFTATIDRHILTFHLPYLKHFKESGYEVHVATNGTKIIPYADVKHTVDFGRSPMHLGNLKAFRALEKTINREKFEIIHTHTPMGGVITRLAAREARKRFGTKVVYTAHGFHFYKGAPKRNWLSFYPVEKLLANITDMLITINLEDYELATKNFETRVEYIPGVGIDESKFDFVMTEDEKFQLRDSLNIIDTDFVIIYAAELSERKRQKWLIETLADLIRNEPRIHLLLPGSDGLNGRCELVAKSAGLDRNIHFLGHRNDIPKLIHISDIAVSSARQEGLPVNIMEAMYAGLPVVVSDCRGNRDLVESSVNGYVVALADRRGYSSKVEQLFNSVNDRRRISSNNLEHMGRYVCKNILEEYKNLYTLNL